MQGFPRLMRESSRVLVVHSHCTSRDVSAALFVINAITGSFRRGSGGYKDLLDSANRSTSLPEIRTNKNMSKKELEG